MSGGAELTWEWEMHGASGKVWVREVQADRRIRFSREGCDPAHPATVEFQFIPHQNDTTYLRIAETGFTGTLTPRSAAQSSPPPVFTFLLSSLKAPHEHGLTLRVTMDAHPPNLQMPSH